MIGTGIFSAPSTIMQTTDSVGASMFFWVLGGVITFWLVYRRSPIARLRL